MSASSIEQRASPRAGPPRLPRPRLLLAVRGVSRENLTREVMAGVTLAALMIPLNIGYAQVAGLPPIVGLYAAILPSIVFALAANTRQVVASPDASAGAIIAAVVGALAVAGTERYLQMVFALALLCGGIFLLFWAFRLGFLANYLSRAILIGYVTGLGLDVLLSQTRNMLGVAVETDGFFRTVVAVVQALPSTHVWSLMLGLGTIVVIRLLKWKAPQLPGALIALVIATVAVALFDLDAQGVRVLGAVPSGLPRLAFPQVTLGDYLSLIPGAIALCAVTLAEAPLLARQYANKHGEKVDADQDFFAFGLTNLVSGLSGGLSLGSSGSRTAAMESVGARSQIPSLVAGVVVALVLLFFTGPLAMLPTAALAGIVAYAVIGLIDVAGFRRLWRVRRAEFWIALVACVAVLTLGVLEGVVIAFLLTTIDLVRRAARPQTSILVEMANSAGYDFTDDL
ncbi:MAG: SulP family inorganic anion transporter, partial [Caldilineaceae bacterium]